MSTVVSDDFDICDGNGSGDDGGDGNGSGDGTGNDSGDVGSNGNSSGEGSGNASGNGSGNATGMVLVEMEMVVLSGVSGDYIANGGNGRLYCSSDGGGDAHGIGKSSCDASCAGVAMIMVVASVVMVVAIVLAIVVVVVVKWLRASRLRERKLGAAQACRGKRIPVCEESKNLKSSNWPVGSTNTGAD
ncbi:hypothetical protein PoB_003310800 [Plakobranchus ocellatus]|uniref:Uncharacterized protein n=1 Tax=Plakobranchus ocellatus TaxID=259542 RepID=A0AAV4AIH7_9GAST|nr:hypothetical protein PoB_003310800 [Plakobranchus ocellatus]